MSWEHYLPAHLSPFRMRDLVDAQAPAETWLTVGTPASPETVLAPGHTDLMVSPETLDAWLDANPLTDDLANPTIVAVRQAGVSGAELLLVLDGQQTVVPLSKGQIANLLQDVAAAIARVLA